MRSVKRCALACLLLGMMLCALAYGTAEQAKSLIVFYRPKRFTGSALTPSIYVDGKQVARLDNGRYFSLPVDPGQHEITSSMKHAPLELTPKPGETIYLEMVILMGTWRGGGRLIPAPADDAQSAIKKLKPLDQKWVTDQRVNFDLKLEPVAAVDHVVPASAAMPVSEPVTSPSSTLPSAASGTPARTAVVHVKSEPAAADVELDGKFVGNTPTTLRLAPGEYSVTIRKSGRREWQRKISALADNEMEISAELEPSN